MKYIIEMPVDCRYFYKKSIGIDLTSNQMAAILCAAKEAVQVKSGMDVCWGEAQAYDFHTRKPVTLYAVEEK